MIKRAFIIHGTYGHPEENWFPYLKRELEQLNIETIIPAFPTPENQTLDAWYQVISPYLSLIDKDSILIGHSLGTPFILNILQDKNIKPAACFLVCPFIGALNHPEIDTLNASIAGCHFDWELIKQRCSLFHIYYSDNDPYIPQTESQKVAKHLGATEHLVSKAGHINENAGYTEFPMLLSHILALADC